MMCEQRVWGEMKHTSLVFAISNVLNNISRGRKTKQNILRWNIASATRNLITFENCSNPAPQILIVEGSVYTRNSR